MTQEKLQFLGASFLTSLGQLQQLPRFPDSVQTSTLGTDGKEWAMESIATLMQWYDICSEKEKEKFWTLIVDFFMLPTPLGAPSRALNLSFAIERTKKRFPKTWEALGND
jgi:hypothetical protein